MEPPRTLLPAAETYLKSNCSQFKPFSRQIFSKSAKVQYLVLILLITFWELFWQHFSQIFEKIEPFDFGVFWNCLNIYEIFCLENLRFLRNHVTPRNFTRIWVWQKYQDTFVISYLVQCVAFLIKSCDERSQNQTPKLTSSSVQFPVKNSCDHEKTRAFNQWKIMYKPVKQTEDFRLLSLSSENSSEELDDNGLKQRKTPPDLKLSMPSSTNNAASTVTKIRRKIRLKRKQRDRIIHNGVHNFTSTSETEREESDYFYVCSPLETLQRRCKCCSSPKAKATKQLWLNAFILFIFALALASLAYYTMTLQNQLAVLTLHLDPGKWSRIIVITFL